MLTIVWGDDRVDRVAAGVLRSACPCASCQGRVEAAPESLVRGVAPVGGYAVRVTFAPDGHGSGIFPFDLLRSLGAEPA